MRVQPIGIAASNLSVFWPLWDAALLRRYGRAKPCPPPTCASLAAACMLAAYKRNLPSIYLPPCTPAELAGRFGADAPPPPEDQPALDLYWPSEMPVDPARIIVVERWLREPDPMPGQLVDLLY